jgi:hypothetical protein
LTVGPRGLGSVRGGLLTSSCDLGGDVEEAEEDGGDVDIVELVEGPGQGAIGIATSTVLLYAGYPSHCLPDRTHLLHCGLVSSHLTLRFLWPT